MKQILIVIGVAIIGILLWQATGKKNDIITTAAENIKMSMEESVLPEVGNPDNAAVIRKAMIEQRKKENSEWTASNIHARPDLYLAHCQKMLTSFIDQYDTAIIETKVELNKNRREIQYAHDASLSLNGFLKEAQKTLLNPEFKYPGKVGSYTYSSAEQVRTAVLRTDKKLTELEQDIASKKVCIAELESALARLEKDKVRVESELRGLSAKKVQVKSGSMKKHVDNVRNRIDALLSGVEALPAVEDAVPNVGAVELPKETAEDVFKRRKIN